MWDIGKTFDMKCQFYILFEITGAIGTPLIIDAATQKRTFGHYAQVLVDIDISRRLIYEFMVEREGFAFPVEVDYEWLPDFCSHCKNPLGIDSSLAF